MFFFQRTRARVNTRARAKITTSGHRERNYMYASRLIKPLNKSFVRRESANL